MASLSEFISGHLDDQGVHDVVVQNFTDFLRVHIAPYGRQELPVSFVGSVAFHYQDQLREAVAAIGRQSGTIIKTPLAGLIRYHQN